MGLHKHLCIPESSVYEMHEYYRQGYSIRETALKFGRSPHGVLNGFRRCNLPVRTRVHSNYLHNDLDTEVKAMYRDHLNGMTYQQIAAKYYVSLSAVKKRFQSRRLKGRVGGSRVKA